MVYDKSIMLQHNTLCLEVGNNYVIGDLYYPTDVTNTSLVWNSDKPSIATVTSDGIITAVSSGTATITATSTDDSCINAVCIVTVTENNLVTSVTVEQSSLVLTVGESYILEETICPENAKNKTVEWKSSDETVVIVNATRGKVRALSEGTARVYAKAIDGSEKRDSCFITVNPIINVTDVTICQKDLTVALGKTKFVVANITPDNAINKNVRWFSNDPEKLSIDSYTGKVCGLKVGEATVTVETLDGCITDYCKVNIITNPLFDTNNTDSLKAEFVNLMGDKKADIPEYELYHTHTTTECIDIIINNDDIITKYANSVDLPKAFIQSIMLRELWCLNTSDSIGDDLVKGYYTWKEAYELWKIQSTEYKAEHKEPTKPVIVKEDSSTGICQILASTAIKAFNEGIDYGYISGVEKLDGTDWKECRKVWFSLNENDDYNIKMATLNIMSCINKYGYGRNFNEYSPNQFKQIFTQYNANQNTINKYGEDCYKYYLIFEKYM